MPSLIPLVGREKELKQVDELASAQGTRRILFLEGEGGVGKTRLLEEVHSIYSRDHEHGLIVTNIVDFDDRGLHVVQNIEGQIMANLGQEAYRDYLKKLQALHGMRFGEVNVDELEKQRDLVRRAPIDNLNRLSSQHRVIMLFDTLDKLEAPSAWERLAQLMGAARNVLFILAGRNALGLRAKLLEEYPDLAKYTEFMPLGHLDAEARRRFMDAKQRQMHITIDPEVATRIMRLTEGKPILIDMAVEWLAHNIALDWLTASEDLTNTSARRLDTQSQFQTRLVEHIGQVRTNMDRLILLMSRVYPVNAEMIAGALAISLEPHAQRLLRQAKDYTFVKAYRGRRVAPEGPGHENASELIYLHDEIRRMVRDYVWPEIDPDGARRKLDSQTALQYLHAQSERLAFQIDEYAHKELQGREINDMETEFDAFVTRQALNQEQWAVREQLLFHTMFINVDEGIRLFTKLFDQATKAYEYAMREVLLDQMRRYGNLAQEAKYLTPLFPRQLYEIDIRRAKYLLDDGKYTEADHLLRNMRNNREMTPEQQVDTDIQLANVVLRLGRYNEAIDFFKNAVAISKDHNMQNWLVKADNGLGWAYRHTANRALAYVHYAEALEIAKQQGLEHEQALLYNNLGFIFAYIPEQRHKAPSYCRASLSLWEKLDDKRGKGRAYSALACINFMNGLFDEALYYFQQALDIFEPVGDREWLSTVYSWRAAVYMSTQRLDLAENDLHRSFKMNVAKDRPMNLSRLGSLYILQEQLDKAQRAIEQCRSLALDQNDVLYQLISIRDLARVARRKKEFDKLEELQKCLKDYLDEWGQPQDRRALGMLYLNFGSLALGRAEVERAIGLYKQGLEPLAELDRYGGDTPEVHVRRLEGVLVRGLEIDPATIQHIGNELLRFWVVKGFEDSHPDVTIQLKRLSTWKGA